MRTKTHNRVMTFTTKWDAVLARDRELDGSFVYAVRSTGVYCRPSCPSRRPRRDRVVFFDRGDEFLAPVVVLPASADEWTEDRRRAVLLHELSHVAQRDCLAQIAKDAGKTDFRVRKLAAAGPLSSTPNIF